MLQLAFIGITLMALSIISLLFLLYTITHLEKLGIEINHPRVIIELMFFIGFLLLGLILWFNQPII